MRWNQRPVRETLLLHHQQHSANPFQRSAMQEHTSLTNQLPHCAANHAWVTHGPMEIGRDVSYVRQDRSLWLITPIVFLAQPQRQ